LRRKKDGVSLGEVRLSIQEGEKREFERLLGQFLGLQLEAAIDKEEIRKLIRNRFADKFGKARGHVNKCVNSDQAATFSDLFLAFRGKPSTNCFP
jgi:hypothetical protein